MEHVGSTHSIIAETPRLINAAGKDPTIGIVCLRRHSRLSLSDSAAATCGIFTVHRSHQPVLYDKSRQQRRILQQVVWVKRPQTNQASAIVKRHMWAYGVLNATIDLDYLDQVPRRWSRITRMTAVWACEESYHHRVKPWASLAEDHPKINPGFAEQVRLWCGKLGVPQLSITVRKLCLFLVGMNLDIVLPGSYRTSRANPRSSPWVIGDTATRIVVSIGSVTYNHDSRLDPWQR